MNAWTTSSRVLTCIILFHSMPDSSCRSFCKPPVTPDTGAECHTHEDCVHSKFCFHKVCQCPYNHYFDVCSLTCLPECNTTISLLPLSGVISGRGYPNSTTAFFCTWSIIGPPSSYIVFSITDLDMSISTSCVQDYIRVYDGLKAVQLLNSSCSSNDSKIRTVASQSNKLTIEARVTSVGFRTFTGHYRIFEYHSKITENFGILASPGFPVQYPPLANLSWTFEGDKYIKLKILYFKLEGELYDNLRIYNESNRKSLLAKVLSESTFNVSTKSNSVQLVMISDGSNEHNGFNASFYVQDLEYGSVCDVRQPEMCQRPQTTCRYDPVGVARCLCLQSELSVNQTCVLGRYTFRLLNNLGG